MFEKWLKVFSTCILFQGINLRELNTMLECLKPRVNSFEKNECVTIAGEKSAGVGFVLSGKVLVTKENAAGDRVIMASIDPGGIFGEVGAFAGTGVWPATIMAQETCIVMFLPPKKITGECEKLCISHRLLVMNMLKIISDKAFMLNRKVEYLMIKSMRGKISTFLFEQYKRTGKATFMIPLKRNELADFLNVSRPSLSREMCRMRDEGIIEFHRSAIRIKDVTALKRMTE